MVCMGQRTGGGFVTETDRTVVDIETGRQPAPLQGFDQRLTVADAARVSSLSEDTIRRGYISGHLKIERMGAKLQCIRIRESELDRWLTNGARTR